jgi:hypothetical protein
MAAALRMHTELVFLCNGHMDSSALTYEAISATETFQKHMAATAAKYCVEVPLVLAKYHRCV